MSAKHYRRSTVKWLWMIECADAHWEWGFLHPSITTYHSPQAIA